MKVHLCHEGYNTVARKETLFHDKTNCSWKHGMVTVKASLEHCVLGRAAMSNIRNRNVKNLDTIMAPG